MKNSRRFFIGIFLFMLLVFAIEWQMPKKFVWSPTYHHTDHQPFGCAVFDSLLSTTFHKGYFLSDQTFYQLWERDSLLRSDSLSKTDSLLKRAFLVVADQLLLSDLDVESVLKIADRGHTVVLVGNSFGKNIEDTLAFKCWSTRSNIQAFKQTFASHVTRDSITWSDYSRGYSKQRYRFNGYLCGSFFKGFDSIPSRVLATKDLTEDVQFFNPSDTLKTSSVYRNYHPAMAFVRQYGEGRLIFVSTPLLFTNYGILDREGRYYISRILSELKDLPVSRLETYNPQLAEGQSPFSFLLSKPPLRTALYLTMLGIILFMFFTAKRKQRIIPVISPPVNRSVEFVELIGSLYFRKQDHADLVKKKYTYLAEELRRTIRVDIDNADQDLQNIKTISQKTGIGEEQIRSFFRQVRPVIYGARSVHSTQMKHFIDQMNEIIKQI